MLKLVKANLFIRLHIIKYMHISCQSSTVSTISTQHTKTKQESVEGSLETLDTEVHAGQVIFYPAGTAHGMKAKRTCQPNIWCLNFTV